MKKIALYVSLAITGLFMTACSEDFKDWANPLSFAQEDAITIPGFTASAIGAIDLNNVGDEVKLLTLSSSELPAGSEVDHVRIITNDQTINAISADGTFAKADLQSFLVGQFGPRPDAHTVEAHVYADVMTDGQAAYVDAGTIQLTMTTEAPIIESAYYYVGATNGWSDSDQTYKFDNGGGDVYENPVFTATIPAPYNEDGTRADNWFKIAPASAYTSGDFWSNLFGVAVDGDTSTEGSLVFNANALNQPGSDGATMYRISINMLEQTYTITPITFKVEPAYYYVGATNGWSSSDKTYALTNGGEDPLVNPVFTAVVPAPFNADGTRADNWFKIAPASAYDDMGNFWKLLIGAMTDGDTSLTGSYDTGDGKDHEPGAFNMPASDGADFYRISINIKDFTYEIKPILIGEQYYVVGGVQGWSDKNKTCMFTPEGKKVLSYTTKWTGAWDLKVWDADSFGNWDVAYGCLVDGDNSASGELVNSGAGAISAPSAEYYTFTIDLNTLTYTWTKLDDQNPTEYEYISLIGEFNGWGGDYELTQVTPHNWHCVFTQETSGQLKYRANHDWSKNWGYGSDLDWNVAEENNKIGTNGGGNIYVPAGTYDVYLNDITNSMIIVAQ